MEIFSALPLCVWNPPVTHRFPPQRDSNAGLLCFFVVSLLKKHSIDYDDVIMDTMASQITSLTIVYSIVYSGIDQRKHESSASLAFVWGINRGPANSPHKGPVTWKMFPFDDVIMWPVIRDTMTVIWRRRNEVWKKRCLKFASLFFHVRDIWVKLLSQIVKAMF